MKEEIKKSSTRPLENSFCETYLSGPDILDIGLRGDFSVATPIVTQAIKIDADYPGYDGKILPFAADSQDCVFARQTLEHIDDSRSAIKEWFRVLRIGGYLVLVVRHWRLSERKAPLPLGQVADRGKFYTAASLLSELEEALQPFSFRVRLLEDRDPSDSDSFPGTDAVGNHEIICVVEKMRRPHFVDDALEGIELEKTIPPVNVGATPNEGPIVTIASNPAEVRNIAVMKLDHRGDFILAKSAMFELRRLFPAAKITLFCGPWNVPEATSLKVFDEVVNVNFFSETGSPFAPIQAKRNLDSFKKYLDGKTFDVAIDLRLDGDTRDLLVFFDARHRAGFGDGFPFLDIALPVDYDALAGKGRAFLGPHRFGMQGNPKDDTVCHRDTYFSVFSKRMIWGPWAPLRAGSYSVELDLLALGRPFTVWMDIVAAFGREIIKPRWQQKISVDQTPIFGFTIDDAKLIEFRVFSPILGFVRPFRFFGCHFAPRNRWRGPHQQELMFMLVALVGSRMANPYHAREMLE